MGGVILGPVDLDYSRNVAEQVREGKPVRNILPWGSDSAPTRLEFLLWLPS